VAFEVCKNGEWYPREEYMHATDKVHARAIWAAGVPKGFMVGINVKIVGIAPVVGVHVHDDKTGASYV
jgi:hypothetical protein